MGREWGREGEGVESRRMIGEEKGGKERDKGREGKGEGRGVGGFHTKYLGH